MFTRKIRPETIRRKSSPRALKFEGLENRALMATFTDNGALWIEGTAANDQVEVRLEGTQMVVDAFDGTNHITWQGTPKPIYFLGKDGNDRFVNNSNQPSYAYGHGGDDTLVGGSAYDYLVGGTGKDMINGNGGEDYLYGDLPFGDALSDRHENPLGLAGDDQIFGGDGLSTIWGGPGQDLIYGGNQRDSIHGDSGHDVIFGQGGDDWLDGGTGNDTIYGGTGNDRLLGNDGADVLVGEQGDDYLDGGYDRYCDTLVGDYQLSTGLGQDTYVQHFVQERVTLSNGQNLYGDSWSEDAIVGFNPLDGDQIDTQVHYVGFVWWSSKAR